MALGSRQNSLDTCRLGNVRVYQHIDLSFNFLLVLKYRDELRPRKVQSRRLAQQLDEALPDRSSLPSQAPETRRLNYCRDASMFYSVLDRKLEWGVEEYLTLVFTCRALGRGLSCSDDHLMTESPTTRRPTKPSLPLRQQPPTGEESRDSLPP